jgi:CelD/BcsL family acetyltransferase involved in cellulose biosynthesis
VKVEYLTSPSAFDAFAEEWDGLLTVDNPAHLFLSRDWQRVWWKHMQSGTLAVVTVRDEANALAGVMPLFIQPAHDAGRVVHIVGCEDVTDYLDFPLQPGCEEAALDAWLGFMLSDSFPGWDIIDLCNIQETSPVYAMLPRLARAWGLNVETRQQDVCPVVTLPGDYEDYLMLLDGKQRHELRRKRKRAEAQGAGFYVVGPERDLDEEIDAFLELMALSAAEKADFLQEPGHRAFFHETGKLLYDRGVLNLVFLTVGGQRAAAMWQFSYGKRMMLYNSGLDAETFSYLSPGIVLLTYSIGDAIRRGFRYYDFLRGDETYKYRMGAETTTVHNIIIKH